MATGPHLQPSKKFCGFRALVSGGGAFCEPHTLNPKPNMGSLLIKKRLPPPLGLMVEGCGVWGVAVHGVRHRWRFKLQVKGSEFRVQGQGVTATEPLNGQENPKPCANKIGGLQTRSRCQPRTEGVLDLGTTTSPKCEVVPRRARI